MPLDLGARKWLRFVLIVAGLYLLLLPIWWYTLEAITLVIATSADLLQHVINPRISINPNGRIIDYFITASDGANATQTSGLKPDTITYGIPMLIALVMATSSSSLIAKLRALLVGLVVFFGLTVPVVLLWGKIVSSQLEEQMALTTGIRASGRSAFFYYIFHGYAFSQPVVAVGIWLGLVAFGFFKVRGKRAETARPAVSRNSPCLCGSGLKYKKCCAKTAKRRA